MIKNTLGSKSLYKLFISVIKYVPNVLALIQIINLILSYLGTVSFALTCIGGTSVTLLAILYLTSYIFRFCGLYRLSLNYVTLITGLTIFDWFIGFPISSGNIYYLYAIITGVFITSWIVYWYKHRNNPKIDHLKQLCDNICC